MAGLPRPSLPPAALAERCRELARHYDGAMGVFAYQAFDHLNAAYFGDALPYPLITWALTPHGRCLGSSRPSPTAPVIALHPALLGGGERTAPWGIPVEHLGPAFACDVLLHECLHLAVACAGGGNGPTSHNDPAWIAEVNRVAPLMELGRFMAGRSTTGRVVTPDAPPGPRGRPRTTVQRRSEATIDGVAVPFAAVAGFPYVTRHLLGATEGYTTTALPFPHALEPTVRGPLPHRAAYGPPPR